MLQADDCASVGLGIQAKLVLSSRRHDMQGSARLPSKGAGGADDLYHQQEGSAAAPYTAVALLPSACEQEACTSACWGWSSAARRSLLSTRRPSEQPMASSAI